MAINDIARARSGRNGSEISQVDVARAAGVSQSVVSRVFRPGASVAPETRSRVIEVAHTLGYRTNAIARSLVTHRTNLVAFIMADLANAFYNQSLALFAPQLQERGFWVLIFKVTGDRELDEALLAALQYQVDGVIITSATLSSQLAEECASRNTPVVLFNRYELNAPAGAVCCDNRAGGRMVADGLLAAGYRRLAFLAGQEGSSTNHDREAGFTNRLGQLGYTGLVRERGDYSYQSGYDATRRLLAQQPRPDAIFCASDMMALGAIDMACSELGLRVPDDVAIVGFDDIPMASWPKYSLTTVRQPIERMVEATLDLLQTAIDTPECERVLRIIPGKLIVRNSAPLKHSEPQR